MFGFRRKLSFPCSSSETSTPETSEEPSMLYYDNDPELPIYSKTSIGYSLSELVEILMNESVQESQVCRIQPLGVSRNCTFIMDLDEVSVEDMRADDLGVWKSNGTRRSYFKLNRKHTSRPDFLSSRPSEKGAGYFLIVRRYFVHQTYSKFRKCIVEIQGKLAMVALDDKPLSLYQSEFSLVD